MLNTFGCSTVETSAAALAVEAGIDGERLITRPLGRQFRSRLELLLRQDRQAIVVMSFAGVDMMDASFADEAFAALAASRGHAGTAFGCLVLHDLGDTSFDNFELAVLSRPTREPGLRNCTIPRRDASGTVRLVCKAEEHVKQTFALLQQHGQLTARDLADRTELDIVAASTRLKVLYNLGLACRHEARDEHGRLYVYASVG